MRERAPETNIDPLHVMSHSEHFCLLQFGGRQFEGQKCIAVIERKVLIVCTTPTILAYFVRYKQIYLYASLVGVVTCVGKERYN